MKNKRLLKKKNQDKLKQSPTKKGKTNLQNGQTRKKQVDVQTKEIHLLKQQNKTA